MTLIFKVDLDINPMHHCTKFRDPGTIGFAFTALKPLSVRALKQKTKNKKQKIKNKPGQN